MPTSESPPTLKLLGGAVILAGNTPLGGPAAHRHRIALLALLAVRGLTSRDKLAAYLWPERDSERARSLLNTAVHELRRVFGENAIRITGDQLSIDPACLRCDVFEFEAAVAAKDYERANALYGGAFLDGFFLEDASEFEHWVDTKRTRLAETHGRVMDRLVARGTPTPGRASVVAPPPSTWRVSRWQIAVATVLLLGVVATYVASRREGVSAPDVSITLAGAAILPDAEAGTALGEAGRVEPRDVFWSSLEPLCGHAFGGRLVEGSPADSLFRRATPIMHVRSCTPTEVRIALHVGTDRSRTWVLTRTNTGLRLKHDHRHADGTEDAITQYGGDTRDSGSFSRQEFHADAHTASLIPAARANVWTVEIVPAKSFVYALRREGTDRRFRLEFDLETVLASPPPPWGARP